MSSAAACWVLSQTVRVYYRYVVEFMSTSEIYCHQMSVYSWWVDWVSCRHTSSFTLSCFFSISLCLILMKLAVNDKRARGYKVTEWILNICINYANWVRGAYKTLFQPRGCRCVFVHIGRWRVGLVARVPHIPLLCHQTCNVLPGKARKRTCTVCDMLAPFPWFCSFSWCVDESRGIGSHLSQITEPIDHFSCRPPLTLFIMTWIQMSWCGCRSEQLKCWVVELRTVTCLTGSLLSWSMSTGSSSSDSLRICLLYSHCCSWSLHQTASANRRGNLNHLASHWSEFLMVVKVSVVKERYINTPFTCAGHV